MISFGENMGENRLCHTEPGAVQHLAYIYIYIYITYSGLNDKPCLTRQNLITILGIAGFI